MTTAKPRLYRVRDLVRRVRGKLESWGEVWVEGELTDLTQAASGHVYFTLDDGPPPAQLRAIMFRGDVQRTKAQFEKGQRLRALGKFSVYEPRGTLQLLVTRVEAAGEGDRAERLARLKKRLAKDGLFDPARKRALPRFPRTVGLVTSPRGAALHDVIRVARGRAPVRLVLSPCVVQGGEAAADIARAIRAVGAVPGVEVVIVTRGGGGSEDLSAFDEESVARAIAHCPVPVVSGVGHEVDVTIADLVADARAATPSNAAELVVPDARALGRDLEARGRRLQQAHHLYLGGLRLRLERVAKRLGEPRRDVGAARAALLGLHTRLERTMRRQLGERRDKAGELTAQLARQEPRRALHRDRAAIAQLERRLERALLESHGAQERQLDALRHRLRAPPIALMRSRLEGLRAQVRNAAKADVIARRGPLGRVAAQLDALSPLAVLGRGYAIALREGRALTRASDAAPGDRIELRLADGALVTRVEESAEK